MFEKRFQLQLVSLNGRLLAVGGRSNWTEFLNCVECYDPFTNTWDFIASMNHKRGAHSAVVHKNRLYVIGGYSKNDFINESVEYYDPLVDKWTMVLLIDGNAFEF